MKPGTLITTFLSKQGDVVSVTTLAMSDLDDLLTYANTLIAEDTTIFMSGSPLTREFEEKYVTDTIRLMEQGKSLRLLARIDGKLVATGDVRFGTLRKSHVAEFGLSVIQEYRDAGIGKNLMKTMIDQCKQAGLRLITLNCFASNARAIHVYESLGFRMAGKLPGLLSYKGNFEDEVIMYLPLV